MSLGIFADTAPVYWSAGLPVIPLRKCDKMPDIKQWQLFGSQMPDEAAQQHWLASFPEGNIGLPFGPASGLCAIDIDTLDEDLVKIIRDTLPPSPWVRIGQKGMGLIYRWERQKNFKLRDADGNMIMEFLGLGNQMVLPPSIHPKTGQPYTANCNLWEVLDQIEPLGTDIEDRLRAALGLRAGKGSGGKFSTGKIVEGGRHSALVTNASHLVRSGASADDVRTLLLAMNQAQCKPPLPEEEVLRIVAHATTKWEQSDAYAFTDLGNALRLRDYLDGQSLYLSDMKIWVHWDGAIWVPDRSGAVISRKVHEVVETLSRSSSEARRKHGLQSQSKARMSAMIDIAQSLEGVTDQATDFDIDLDILGTPSGVWCLRTGTQLPSDPMHRVMKRTAVDPDPAMPTPIFDRTLGEIMENNPAKIRLLEDMLGYALTGRTDERKMLFCTGVGANGKSLIMNFHMWLMGDYACTTPALSLMQQRSASGPQPEIVDLMGKRFTVANEGGRDDVLDTARIKSLTGQDLFKGRELHANTVEFPFLAKIVYVTNFLPQVDPTDQAIWDRLVILSFTRRFTEDERDPALREKLEAEAPGILAKCIRWASRWYRERLTIADEIRAETRAYRQGLDHIGSFLEECCIVKDGARESARLLYYAYKDYMSLLDHEPISQCKFGLSLSERGFKAVKSGDMFRMGLALKPRPPM